MEPLVALSIVTLGLVAIPGPNVALTLANSLRYGTRYGLCTVAGTTVGVGLQLILVVLGIGTLLEIAADILTWLKWAGVAYLLWLGYRSWISPPDDLSAIGAVRAPVLRLFTRGLVVAVLNPKTLIFNAALLPQFVAPDGSYLAQLALVALVFLTVLTLGDALWAVFAGALRPLMLRYQRIRNRITGGFLIAAGIGLALTGRK
ncbi:LysE family transporter [Sneathiella chungangensis]|uniref:LysE family transporter n=1 Tax=Sneathiella chungangensis TaxID=1418234 RepID=A0A845MD97_9PROT|nr:LysE family translocator [Sneathiella chungangensis]MZR21340.1 LysE family transporter [Sneathiella chungangensis]